MTFGLEVGKAEEAMEREGKMSSSGKNNLLANDAMVFALQAAFLF